MKVSAHCAIAVLNKISVTRRFLVSCVYFTLITEITTDVSVVCSS
jgi:hypothetical protein